MLDLLAENSKEAAQAWLDGHPGMKLSVGNAEGPIRTTTIAQLIEQGSLAPIWYQVIPQEDLHDGVHRSRFYDLSSEL